MVTQARKSQTLARNVRVCSDTILDYLLHEIFTWYTRGVLSGDGLPRLPAFPSPYMFMAVFFEGIICRDKRMLTCAVNERTVISD